MSRQKNNGDCLINLIPQLRLGWFDLLQKLSADLKFADEIFAHLIRVYTSPIRSYHNLEHIREVLKSLAEVKNIAQDINALYLCAWLHDYIYNPQALDNEVKSVVYAKQVLKQLNVDTQFIQLVKQIILSTKKHEPLIEGIDNLFFLDADLAILGANSQRYWQYADSIRQEYAHLSEVDYQQARKKILTQFLARKRIYYTDIFSQKLESNARKNLQTEINQLTLNNHV